MGLHGKGKIILTVLTVFVLLLLILMSPLFVISDVSISGNGKLTKEQIMDFAGVSLGMNIFRYSINKNKEALETANYIKSAKVSISLPGSVNIDIVERKVCGYVPYMGTYLYIDSDGFVLENQEELTESCPVVSGLRFTEFSVGETLAVENTSSFDIVLTMSRALQNYDYLEAIREINISNPDDIHLYIKNVDVYFGDINDSDKKLRTIIEIMKKLSDDDKGTLHIEDLKNTPYFSYTI